jgi:DNA-binding LacI/PurR family transcriptional regulator
MDRNTGQKSLEQLVNRRDEYDAVVAASDMQAFKVMSALQSVGVDIPCDVAVIGYDDIPAAAIYHPTLTTKRQDRSTGAELLVDNLMKVLDGKGPSCIELEPELIKRESA